MDPQDDRKMKVAVALMPRMAESKACLRLRCMAWSIQMGWHTGTPVNWNVREVCIKKCIS